MASDELRTVFVSYTSELGKYPEKPCTYIAAVLEGIRKAGFVAKHMLDYAAEDLPAADVDARHVRECDVYLGVIGLRWGSPVLDRQDVSYTQHEFEVATESGKPRLIFELDEGAELPGVPPMAVLDVENWDRQKEFREQAKSARICKFFSTPQQLEYEVEKALRELAADAASGRLEGSSAPAEFTDVYRNWLRKECADIELLGLKLKQGQSARLSSVYVPLTTPEHRQDKLAEANDPQEAAARLAGRQEKTDRLLLDALGDESLYVSGDAGTGKSTFCRWLALMLCEEAVPAHDVEPPEEFRETFPEEFRGRLPLLIRLRAFWEHLPKTPGRRELTRVELELALKNWLEDTRPADLTWTTVRSFLERGMALLIFDGVDEVPRSDGDDFNPYAPRQMLLSGLAKAIPEWHEAGNRLLLTSRPYGLNEQEATSLGVRQARIGDLPRPLQELLVRRWFAILEADRDGGTNTADKMSSDLASRPELTEMQANPMLLTAMCVIYGEGKRLPQDKHDLYDRIVDNVLHNRFPDDPTRIDPVRDRLRVVAYGMHTGETLDSQRTTPEAEVSYEEVDYHLLNYDNADGFSGSEFKKVVATRELLLGQTGLLLPREDKRVGFYHFSLQEFLAAERHVTLKGVGGVEVLSNLIELRAGTSEWHNTLSFFFSALLANDLTRPHTRALLDWLVNVLTRKPADETLGLQVVTTECMQIYRRKGFELKEEWIEAFRAICIDAIEREVSLRERHRLGLFLGEFGDPRIVEDLRDRAAYVEIPAGTYLIGDDKKPWELERSFCLGRYPVTNSQFGKFLDDGGYQASKWWSEEGWTWLQGRGVSEPRFWQSGRWNNPSQPVVGVSFWEAEAFAKWAGGRLPTANEWEAAARGPDGLVYPWGDEWDSKEDNERCNFRDAGLGITSPVGLFPRSRSKEFGLEDMAGNVWEWTSDLVTSSGRVLRGGSYFYNARYVRAALRNHHCPGNRDSPSGFRLART